MINLPKVRYAVLVAIIGLAVALWPGLTDLVSEVIRIGSAVVGVLWGLLRIALEFMQDDSDPMIYTMSREPLGFWGKLKRAL